MPADDYKEWTPASVIALWTAITLTIGGAVSWMVNQGFSFYTKVVEFRMKKREQKAALIKVEEKSRVKFSADQIFEDRDIGMGYKVWMFNQQREVNELKSAMVELNTHYLECIQERAQAQAQAKESKEQVVSLQRQVRRLQRELKIDPNEECSEDGNKT